LGGAFAASGALAIAGALLPWLTLYAGLYQYNGLVGLYGRLILAVGAIVTFAAVAWARAQWRWLGWAGIALGIALCAFAAWLFAGLQEIVHRPEAMMAVAQPGPGLRVVFAAGVLMALSSAAIAREMVVLDHERPRVR
jgi:hypothetical protein